MTIKEYSAAKGIGYHTVHRAVKFVYNALSKPIARGPVALDMTPGEVDLVDRYFKARGEVVATYPRERSKWLATWLAASESKDTITATLSITIVLMLQYVRTVMLFRRVIHNGRRLGDFVVSVCYRSEVEKREDGNWEGFTLWLLEQGYKP